MFFLQQTISLSKEGMYVAAISSLVAVVVWLALYIRRLHNKTIEYLKEDKKEMVEVISKNTTSAESQTRSNDRLSDTIEELHKTILIQNSRHER